MMFRTLQSRIARLEERRAPRSSYVVNFSDPPTSDERAQLAKAQAEGRCVAVLPWKCASIKEWQAKYGSGRHHA